MSKSEDRKHALWSTYDSEIQLVFERMGNTRLLSKDELDDIVRNYKKCVEWNNDNWVETLETAISNTVLEEEDNED